LKFGLEIDFEVEIQSRDRGSGYCRAVADAGLYLCASFTVSVERVRSLNERLSRHFMVRWQHPNTQTPPYGQRTHVPKLRYMLFQAMSVTCGVSRRAGRTQKSPNGITIVSHRLSRFSLDTPGWRAESSGEAKGSILIYEVRVVRLACLGFVL
jgi:hypothetical protein